VSYEVASSAPRLLLAAQGSYPNHCGDLENTRLIITAELAGDFSRCASGYAIGILRRTVDALSKVFELGDSAPHNAVSEHRVLTSEQDGNAPQHPRTQSILLQLAAAQLEDVTISPFWWVNRAGFTFLKDSTPERLLNDAGLPSDLLERRPDIAEAPNANGHAPNSAVDRPRRAYSPL